MTETIWNRLSLDRVRLPRVVRLRQQFVDDSIADAAAATREALDRAGLAARVRPGGRYAITAGSRGIDRIVEVTRATVDAVRAAGGEPFVVAAMGSHGGATAEGQREVLAGYGITEASMGCPLSTAMDAVPLGQTETGYTLYCDRAAFEADGVILLNRVKPHSILVGELGSGLLKMLAIGLGKQIGADSIHSQGLQEHFIPAARLALSKVRVTLGVALVEDSFDRLATVEAVAPEEMEETDRRLLARSRKSLPNIPFDPLDVLIIGRIGKEISGAGMDPNVVGMHRRLGGPPTRDIRRIVALDLSEGSHGNAIGVGMADIVTERLLAKVDWEAAYMNALTSDFLWGVKRPIAAPDDRAAIRLALRPFDHATVRVVAIRDTAHLESLWVSEALAREAAGDARLVADGEPSEMTFEDGRLRLA